jgi:hypothetical protein
MSKLTLLGVTILILLNAYVYAQNGLSVSVGEDIGGLTQGYQFNQHGTVLKRTFLSNNDYSSGCWNWSLRANYRFHNVFAIDIGLTETQIDLSLSDKYFLNNHTIQNANPIAQFNFTQNYIGPSIGVYYYFPLLKYYVNPYISAGVDLNFRTKYHTSDSPPFYATSANQFWQPTNEKLQLNVNYKSFYPNFYLETGLAFSIWRINAFFGFRYNMSEQIMTGAYKDFQNGLLLYSDNVSAPGNYFSFSLRGGYILIKQKPYTKATRPHVNDYSPHYEYKRPEYNEQQPAPPTLRQKKHHLKERVIPKHPHSTIKYKKHKIRENFNNDGPKK